MKIQQLMFLVLGVLGSIEIIVFVPGIQLFPSFACGTLLAIGIWGEDLGL